MNSTPQKEQVELRFVSLFVVVRIFLFVFLENESS